MKPLKRGVLNRTYSAEREKKLPLKFRLSVRAAIVAFAVHKYAAKRRGLTLLDLGAAEGRTLIEMSNMLPGNNFVGIEYSSELIHTTPGLPENISLLQGDATELPTGLGSACFDCISALAVLEHLEKPLHAVREAYRAAKPGGLFVATSPVPVWDCLSSKLGLLKDGGHVVRMNGERFTGIMTGGGFRLLEYGRFMWAPLSFLPYLHIPISAGFSINIDRWITRIKLLDWLFVNRYVIGRKPSRPDPGM